MMPPPMMMRSVIRYVAFATTTAQTRAAPAQRSTAAQARRDSPAVQTASTRRVDFERARPGAAHAPARADVGPVVAAAAQLSPAHRHGHDSVEVVVVVRRDEIAQRVGERLGEPVVALELEGPEDALERAARMAPGIGPVDGKRIHHAIEATRGLDVARPRLRAGVALRAVDERKQPPAVAAA